MCIGSCKSYATGWNGQCLLRAVGSNGGRYYEGGVSSVYFWDLDDGFAGVILLKKGTNMIRLL